MAGFNWLESCCKRADDFEGDVEFDIFQAGTDVVGEAQETLSESGNEVVLCKRATLGSGSPFGDGERNNLGKRSASKTMNSRVYLDFIYVTCYDFAAEAHYLLGTRLDRGPLQNCRHY